MKLRFGNVYLRLGAAPTATSNFFSLHCGASACVLRVATFAEQFDSALTFYVELADGLCSFTERCWFELQRQRRRRLPDEIATNLRRFGYTQQGALYGPIRCDNISLLLNEFWLSDRFRIIGTPDITATKALELAASIAPSEQVDSLTLPAKTIFALEKQYLGNEPFLFALFANQRVSSVRKLISRAAAGLKRPLLEVGLGGWPPSDQL